MITQNQRYDENANGKKKKSAVYKLFTLRKSKTFYCVSCTVFILLSIVFVKTFITLIEDIEESRFYSMHINDIDGNRISLREYRHKVILVVNVASNSTMQHSYQALQKVYERHKGLMVIGFPTNEFGHETGTNKEISKFVKKLGITFPIMEKVEVNGKLEHPIFTFIKSYLPGDVQGDFEKFFINKHGYPVSRHPSSVSVYTLESEIARLLYTT